MANGLSVLKENAILADLDAMSKACQMAILQHCIGEEDFHILKVLNLIENEDANDMQSVMVKLDIYCSKQTIDIFEQFKLDQRCQGPY